MIILNNMPVEVNLEIRGIAQGIYNKHKNYSPLVDNLFLIRVLKLFLRSFDERIDRESISWNRLSLWLEEFYKKMNWLETNKLL